MSLEWKGIAQLDFEAGYSSVVYIFGLVIILYPDLLIDLFNFKANLFLKILIRILGAILMGLTVFYLNHLNIDYINREKIIMCIATILLIVLRVKIPNLLK
jgi:uncharacterized membrane protein YczE